MKLEIKNINKCKYLILHKGSKSKHYILIKDMCGRSFNNAIVNNLIYGNTIDWSKKDNGGNHVW